MTVTKQVSIHGKRVFVTDDDQLAARNGFVAGGDDKPSIIMTSPDTVALFDDFLGTHIGLGITDTGNPSDTGQAGMYFITRKGDTGHTGKIVAGTNGVFRFGSTATIGTVTIATATAGFCGPELAWKVNQGPGAQSGRLRLATRIKKSTYLLGNHGMFVGFTDTTAAEIPVFDTGGTADLAQASNAFGIGWNVKGDTGWVGYGVDGDTVQQVLLDSTTPTDNKYVVLEMEAHRGSSDTGGTVTFFIDGIPKGSIDNPVNVTTGLTPCVYVFDTGGAANVDVDWINVSAPRDTGL